MNSYVTITPEVLRLVLKDVTGKEYAVNTAADLAHAAEAVQRLLHSENSDDTISLADSVAKHSARHVSPERLLPAVSLDLIETPPGAENELNDDLPTEAIRGFQSEQKRHARFKRTP